MDRKNNGTLTAKPSKVLDEFAVVESSSSCGRIVRDIKVLFLKRNLRSVLVELIRTFKWLWAVLESFTSFAWPVKTFFNARDSSTSELFLILSSFLNSLLSTTALKLDCLARNFFKKSSSAGSQLLWSFEVFIREEQKFGEKSWTWVFTFSLSLHFLEVNIFALILESGTFFE